MQNKRGQEGPSWLLIILVILVIVAAIYIAFVSNIFRPVTQVGEEAKAIASALTPASCKVIAEQFGDAGLASYCEYRKYTSTFGVEGWVNCAYDKLWSGTAGYAGPIEASKCTVNGKTFCEEMKVAKGTAYNSNVRVNGKVCGASTASEQGWNVLANSATTTTAGPGTTANTAVAWTGDITKSCVQQGGDIKPYIEECVVPKNIRRISGFSDIDNAKNICCTV